MTPADLRAIIDFLRQRVSLDPRSAPDEPVIAFAVPTAADMLAAGLDDEGVKRVLDAPWWDEMVEDIVETPEMCEPGEAPPQVLQYARDVVSEYIAKRFEL